MKASIIKKTFIVLTFIISVISAAAAERYRVSDNVLTVWDSPEYLHSLGQMHRGDEFDVIGHHYDMLIFEYNGHRAYVAEYCCERVQEAPAAQARPSAPVEKENEVVPPADDKNTTAQPARDTQPAQSTQSAVSGSPAPVRSDLDSPVHSGRSSHSRSGNQSALTAEIENMPRWLALLIAAVMMAGCIFGFWNVFGHQSLSNIFDGLAGDYISNCSVLMRFRPAIIFFLFGLSGFLLNSYKYALIVAAVYEIILLIIRTRALNSFRAAVVEAIYLGLNAIGVFAILAAMLFLAFLASGGSGKGKKDDEDENSCRNCRYYRWGVSHCELDIYQDSDAHCRHFSSR